ncbi:prepilin peptidase CpaA [Comamonas odontotermitis]|uniref:Prepilin peptidase CpaA n=1 Tax=Comamonas odontotermitis TaxID=379895 RepID=A0ABR6RI91_9BURK|nr:A24 family peptidase [Comamonas odontotermitis]MBB6578871.1 prepilin peptidase CpaA [Comamonas odontotermitis]
MTTTWLLSCVLLLWLAVVAAMDLHSRKVRNWMVLLGLATGTVALFSGVQPFWVEPWSGLVGAAAAFAILLPFYALRWMGAGDVKFAAVMGLWFGISPYLLAIWLGGSLLAGLHGMAVLAWRRLQLSVYGGWLQAHLPAPLAASMVPATASPTTTASGKRVIQRSIPYAGYMAIAAIWVVLRTGPSLAN